MSLDWDGKEYRLDKKIENLAIRFFYKDVLDEFQTKTQGKPIYRKDIYIEKVIPGDQTRIIRRATDEDKAFFADQLERFLQNKAEAPKEGQIPLTAWADLPESLIEKLNQNHIQTVEQLASLGDNVLQKIDSNLLHFKYQAIEFIKTNDMKINRLEKENEELKKRLEKLEGKGEANEPNSKGDNRSSL